MKKVLPLIVVLFIITAVCTYCEAEELYAVAQGPTPVLNTPDFSSVFGGGDGRTLKVDKSGLIREVEFIALAGTVFSIQDTIKKEDITIYKVTTGDYPYPTKTGYFIDKRSVKTLDYKVPDRIKKLPCREKIIQNLLSSVGSIYIWGGNYKEGIKEMLRWYPPSSDLSGQMRKKWKLEGVDCSGLLYEATDGVTPRNTSALINYGEPVEISGRGADEIIQQVEPLDLIVWDGHVIIVLDKRRVIESRLDYDKTKEGNQGGVKVRSLAEVLDKTLRKKVPVDDYRDDAKGREKFVIRRWYNT